MAEDAVHHPACTTNDVEESLLASTNYQYEIIHDKYHSSPFLSLTKNRYSLLPFHILIDRNQHFITAQA